MTSEEVTTKFMFGLLDYETWILQYHGQDIGIVTCNPVDNRASLKLHWPSVHTHLFTEAGNCQWWMRFCRDRQGDVAR